jgi:hypothetical protein
MNPIKASHFLEYLQGEVDAFRSILVLTETQAQELLNGDKELDTARSRLAHHIMQTHPKPINGADALLLALDRAEIRLYKIQQTAVSLDPIMDL